MFQATIYKTFRQKHWIGGAHTCVGLASSPGGAHTCVGLASSPGGAW